MLLCARCVSFFLFSYVLCSLITVCCTVYANIDYTPSMNKDYNDDDESAILEVHVGTGKMAAAGHLQVDLQREHSPLYLTRCHVAKRDSSPATWRRLQAYNKTGVMIRDFYITLDVQHRSSILSPMGPRRCGQHRLICPESQMPFYFLCMAIIFLIAALASNLLSLVTPD